MWWILFLFGIFIIIKNPTIYQKILIELALHALYASCRIQMLVYKIKRAFKNKPASNYYEFISANNEIVYRKDKMNTNDVLVPYDLIIYSAPTDTVVHKRLAPEIVDTIEPSNVRFLLIELRCNGQTTKLEFVKNDDNYYIVGNRIDRRFLQYLMTKYYTACNLDTYTLFIIDHNASIIEINSTQTIQLEKDTYTIQ